VWQRIFVKIGNKSTLLPCALQNTGCRRTAYNKKANIKPDDLLITEMPQSKGAYKIALLFGRFDRVSHQIIIGLSFVILSDMACH
jgi:hypothetical protein